MVSVILPFYNAEATLARAIESIRSQTLTDWELIAWDDGSTDNSPKIAAKQAQEDARIKLQGGAHTGIVGALQQACALARGHYIARMDADDVSLPNRLEKQFTFLESHPGVTLCGAQVQMVGEGIGSGRRRYEQWLNALASHEDIVRDMFIECPIAHPAFFLRCEAFETAGGYQDHGWPEDYDLIMRLWQQGGRLANLPEPLLQWHDATNRLSMTDPRYEEGSFRALKRHHLARTYLKGRESFYQWGAGEVGKRWLREWGEMRPEAVVDINPRKIGREIHGTLVIEPEPLPPPGESFIVIAVGTPGAREDIRAWLNPRGYTETLDYLFLA